MMKTMQRIMCLMVIGMFVVGSAVGVVITEDFDGIAVATNADSGGLNNETPVIDGAPDWDWGGYANSTATGTNYQVKVRTQGDLEFKNGTLSTLINGSYAYADIETTLNDLTDISLAFTGSDYSTNASLRAMIRQGAGNWYISDAVAEASTMNFNVGLLNWFALSGGDMDDMDNGGEGALAIGFSATPSFDGVDRMGLYMEANGGKVSHRITSISLTGTEVPEPATLVLVGLGSLLLRKRR